MKKVTALLVMAAACGTTGQAVMTTSPSSTTSTTLEQLPPATTTTAQIESVELPVDPAPSAAPDLTPEPGIVAPPDVPGSGTCGGRRLPPCAVMKRESGGNPGAISPRGYCRGHDTRCYGKWQFDAETWWALGYTGLPSDADERVQDQAAETLWDDGNGCGNWGAC